MAKDYSLITTGQLHKIPGIPPGPTVQRYVLILPELFSPGARLSTKRRRFTSTDVQLVLAIRGYCDRGFTFEAIKNLIKDGHWDPKKVNVQQTADAIRMLIRAEDVMDQIREMEFKIDQTELELRKTIELQNVAINLLQDHQKKMVNAFNSYVSNPRRVVDSIKDLFMELTID